MTPEEYSRLRDLFDRAMELPLDERQRFVDGHAAPGDPLRSELMAMVEAGDDSVFLVNALAAGVLDQARAADDLPVQIGNYRILRVLGRGGMGVVYLALRNDDVFHKVVALKVIGSTADAGAANLVQRFKQERQILAGLDHPNIARILDGGSAEDGRPFYVMEYVAGSPISDYCARMNADAPARVRMIAQACDAVEYLHDHAIAHRDVKPQNILVTLDGRVKLVDFGIAKVEAAAGLLRSPSPSGQPTMIMTPGYASPEQISGDSSGKSGDIYSLAVVLYQLLTGRLPYTSQDGRPSLTAQLSGKAPEPPSKGLTKAARPSTRLTDLRRVSYPDLDRVVLKALQRDPLQRYQTVQLFAEDLRRCLDGRPVAARQPNWAYRFRKLVIRNPLAAVCAAVILVSGGVGSWRALAVKLERVEFEAKEAELERFVNLLDAKVAGWQTRERAVPATEKVADVQAANRIMASDTVRTLSARAPDPPRLKRLVGDLRRVLDRADELSHDLPTLRKEIALVFRQIGDFESTAPLAQLADRNDAVRSYRRAAGIVADIRPAEPGWADQQIGELTMRLNELGSTPDTGVVPVAEAPPPLARATAPPSGPPGSESPQRRVRTESRTHPESQAGAVNPAVRLELTQRLQSITLDAARARRSFETVKDTLANRGQTIRPDVLIALTEGENLIQDTRNYLNQNDLAAAEDCLRRAGVQLRKVFQSVGG